MADTETYPVLERITLDLLDTMATVTTAGGFRYTTFVERRDPQEGNSPFDAKVVLHMGDAEDADAPLMAVGFRQHFTAEIFVFELQGSDVPTDRRLAVIAADLTKVLNADYRRNNDAIDTTVGQVRPIEATDGALAAGAMSITVYYRTQIDDPYTSR